MEAGGAVGVEEAGPGDEDGVAIENRGLKEVTQESIVFVVSLDRETMNGKLEIGRGKAEGQPGIIVNWEGLIELVGESVEKRRVGSSRNRNVDNCKGHSTIVVNKVFNANREAGVSFHEHRGGQVGPANADKIAFSVGSRGIPAGVESPSGTGEEWRALG